MVRRSVERRTLMPAGCRIDHGYHSDYSGATDEVVRRPSVPAAHPRRLAGARLKLADDTRQARFDQEGFVTVKSHSVHAMDLTFGPRTQILGPIGASGFSILRLLTWNQARRRACTLQVRARKVVWKRVLVN